MKTDIVNQEINRCPAENFFSRFSADITDEISADEPQWLMNHRKKSFGLFQKLPLEKSELFKKYAEVKIQDGDFRVAEPGFSARMPSELGFAYACNGSFLFLQRDCAAESRLPKELEEKGIILGDIITAVKTRSFLQGYFEDRILKPEEEKMVAFNNAFFNSGFFLYVPDGVRLQTPFRSSTLLAAENACIVSQNIIMLGENAGITWVEEVYAPGRNSCIFSNVTELHLKAGAVLKAGGLHVLGNNTTFLNRRALLENSSSISWSSGFFGSALTLSKLDNVMQGRGAEAQDSELVFGSGSQRFDISSDLIHTGESTAGKVAVKGVFRDSSSAVFKGMINIGRHAGGSSAFLAEHAILLSENAKADAIPGLQIENNNVKATHSASVAQLSEEQLFYLMSKGFSRDEAKKLIVLGFFEPLLRQMPVSEVKLRIRALAELKWRNEPLEMLGKISETIEEEEKKTGMFEGHYKYR